MQPVAAQRTLCRRQNAYTMGPKLVPQIWKLGYILILVLWNPFLGPESGPCFGATKHKQEQVNTGSKCATADASWQQHIPVILYEHIERHTLGTHGTTTTYHTLHPTSHWIRYVRCLFDSWFGQLPAPSSRKTGTLNFWRPSNNSASELLIYSILLVWNINWAIFFAWTLWCPQTWVENSSSVYMGMGQKPGT